MRGLSLDEEDVHQEDHSGVYLMDPHSLWSVKTIIPAY